MKVTCFLLAVICASALASFPVNNYHGYGGVGVNRGLGHGFGVAGTVLGHGYNYGYNPYGYNNGKYNGYNGGYNGYNGNGPKVVSSGHGPYGYGYNNGYNGYNGYNSYNNYYPQH